MLRGVSRMFFIRGRVHFWRVLKYQGQNRAQRVQNVCPPPHNKKIMQQGQNRQKGEAEHLIITKKGLILASAPYAPNAWELFHQGQKHTISNFIRGKYRVMAYAPLIRLIRGIRPLCFTPLAMKYNKEIFFCRIWIPGTSLTLCLSHLHIFQ